jgi:hypothetical protein
VSDQKLRSCLPICEQVRFVFEPGIIASPEGGNYDDAFAEFRTARSQSDCAHDDVTVSKVLQSRTILDQPSGKAFTRASRPLFEGSFSQALAHVPVPLLRKATIRCSHARWHLRVEVFLASLSLELRI